MGSTELAANLFRITQIDEVLKNKNIDNENDACDTHYKVGKSIRKANVAENEELLKLINKNE